MTFKQELIDLAYDLVNTDPDLSTVSKKATLTRTTKFDGWDDDGLPFAPVVQTVNIRATFDQYTTEQATLKNAAMGDVMCLLPSKKLKLKPLQNDTITVDAVAYNVVEVEIDAAGAAYTLQLRKRVL